MSYTSSQNEIDENSGIAWNGICRVEAANILRVFSRCFRRALKCLCTEILPPSKGLH